MVLLCMHADVIIIFETNEAMLLLYLILEKKTGRFYRKENVYSIQYINRNRL